MRSASLVPLLGLREKGPGIWDRLVEARAVRLSVQAERDFLEGREERGQTGLNWLRRWAGPEHAALVEKVEEARKQAEEYRQRCVPVLGWLLRGVLAYRESKPHPSNCEAWSEFLSEIFTAPMSERNVQIGFGRLLDKGGR